MEEKIISNYNELLLRFENILKESKNEELKTYIRGLYETFIVDLAKREKKDIDHYADKLKSVGIKNEKIVEIINNIKEKTSLYIDDLGGLISKPSSENENNISLNEEKNKAEEYILNEVYRNKNEEIGDKHRNLIQQLRNNFINPNELSIKTWLKNYLSYIDNYKELNKEYLISYMKILFKELDKDGKYFNNIDKYIEEIEKDKIEVAEVKDTLTKEEKDNNKSNEVSDNAEPLKIINIKRSHLSKGTKNIFKALGLVGIASTFGLPASILSFIIYKMYKKVKNSNIKLNNFIGKNGYKINDQDELIDKDGKVVTEDSIEKEKVGFLKSKLMNLSKDKGNGLFSRSYKKNRFTSMLLNMKLSRSLKDKFKTKLYSDSDKNVTNENSDIYKGMGKC